MTEADILATTYEDTVTVYRAFKDTLPGGESVFKSGLDGKVVYEDVECALSTHTGGKLQQSKSTAKTETTFCLFTRPEVDIQTNDFLVITHFGKKIEAVAGFPECMKSHNNIPAEFREMVIDLAVQLQGKVKDNTPVKTGHLRNEWHVGSIEKRGNEYYIEVYNNVEYVEPVEYGHQTRGGKGFVKGAHMMELSLQEVQKHLPGYLREWMNDFLNTHEL